MAAADLLEQRVNTLAYNCVCTSVHPRAGGICRGCRATEMGRNCWEMAVSPCCDLSRDSCDTCPGFAAAMRELSLAENARIVLEGGAIVEGEVYLRRDQRLSDAINDPTKDYIAVADATIYPPRDSWRITGEAGCGARLQARRVHGVSAGRRASIGRDRRDPRPIGL